MRGLRAPPWDRATSLAVLTVAGLSAPPVAPSTAPMHDGFSGGAFLDAAGALIGMTAAAAIRGFGVVIPAGIVWKTAAHGLEHGGSAGGISASSASRCSYRIGAVGSP